MEYRVLGQTNLRVSSIGIGTWQLSGPVSIDDKADGFPDIGKAEAVDLIRVCGDFGVNFIDSGEIYGAGEGERRVGEALKGQRDRWIISTKFGLRRGSDGGRIVDSRPETIRESLESSLTRLQTEYVDIYLYHTPPEPDLVEAGKTVLDQLRQEGKIRFYGISIDDSELVHRLVRQNAIEVVMFPQSLLRHPDSMLDLIQEYNLGSIVRGAFESGLLAGRYFRNTPHLSSDDIRQGWFSSLDTKRYQVYERFLPVGVPMSAFALRYLLDFATTHTIVLGGKSLKDYQDALKAFEMPPLDAGTHQALRKARQDFHKRSLTQRIAGKIRRILLR